MSEYLGIIFALIALVSWGVGDFFIQRSARKFGDWESIFAIEITGLIVLLPFVFWDLGGVLNLSGREILILLAVGLAFMLSSLLSTEALKKGKLAVIESIEAVEIAVAGLIAYFVFNESLAYSHWFFIAVLVIGILLVALKPHHFKKKAWLERGAVIGFFGSILIGFTDFMVGFGSRVTSPLFVIWFASLIMVAIIAAYLGLNGRFKYMLRDFWENKKLLLGIGIFDNLAWFAFAISTLYLPIAVALALSEGYIILAVILGILINKEKLQSRQFVGIALAIIGAVALSIIYS